MRRQREELVRQIATLEREQKASRADHDEIETERTERGIVILRTVVDSLDKSIKLATAERHRDQRSRVWQFRKRS